MSEECIGVAMDLQIIIPVYNPDEKFIRLLEALKAQTYERYDLLIIDSGKQQNYIEVVKDWPRAAVKKIPFVEFNHGGTRQMGVDMWPGKDVYVFFTQDAVLADDSSLEKLAMIFEDTSIGCAYGRQLPFREASFFARGAREINYPASSHIMVLADKVRYGIKTVFFSNSFAAYRGEALAAVGGFPKHTILCEDMYTVAKMLMRGYKKAYVAEACVYHSHDYSIWQEFKRYFDLGVFHSREKWIRQTFGGAGGSGVDFVKCEILLIRRETIGKQPLLLCEMVVRDSMKLLGYRLGMLEGCLPVALKRRLSMMAGYWSEGVSKKL